MDQNLMVQELSDNDLEQVVGGGHFGGHHCKPKRHECHDYGYHYCEPKPCYPHYRHCEPHVRCHADLDLCF